MKLKAVICLLSVLKLLITESVTQPCSTAPVGSEVLDICDKKKSQQPVNPPFLIRVTKMQECNCVLSVLNSDTTFTSVYFIRYAELSSSHPGGYSCGVALRFVDQKPNYKDIFNNIECIMSTNISKQLDKYQKIVIETYFVFGNLSAHSGYCIQVTSDIGHTSGKKLQLECSDEHIIPFSHSEPTQIWWTTTTSSTSKNIPQNQEVSTSTIPVVTNISRTFENQQQTQEDDINRTIVIVVASLISGVVLVCAIILVFICKRISIKKKKEQQQHSDIFVHDGLQYNEFYQPGDCELEHQTNKNACNTESHYNTIDSDDIQEHKRHSLSDRKVGITEREKDISKQSSVKYTHTLGTGCEYAVVDKTRKTIEQERKSDDIPSERRNTMELQSNTSVKNDGVYVNLAFS